MNSPREHTGPLESPCVTTPLDIASGGEPSAVPASKHQVVPDPLLRLGVAAVPPVMGEGTPLTATHISSCLPCEYTTTSPPPSRVGRKSGVTTSSGRSVSNEDLDVEKTQAGMLQMTAATLTRHPLLGFMVRVQKVEESNCDHLWSGYWTYRQIALSPYKKKREADPAMRRHVNVTRTWLVNRGATCFWHSLLCILASDEVDELNRQLRDNALDGYSCGQVYEGVSMATAVEFVERLEPSKPIAVFAHNVLTGHIDVLYGKSNGKSRGVLYVYTDDANTYAPHWLPVLEVKPHRLIPTYPALLNIQNHCGLGEEHPWLQELGVVIAAAAPRISDRRIFSEVVVPELPTDIVDEIAEDNLRMYGPPVPSERQCERILKKRLLIAAIENELTVLIFSETVERIAILLARDEEWRASIVPASNLLAWTQAFQPSNGRTIETSLEECEYYFNRFHQGYQCSLCASSCRYFDELDAETTADAVWDEGTHALTHTKCGAFWRLPCRGETGVVCCEWGAEECYFYPWFFEVEPALERRVFFPGSKKSRRPARVEVPVVRRRDVKVIVDDHSQRALRDFLKTVDVTVATTNVVARGVGRFARYAASIVSRGAVAVASGCARAGASTASAVAREARTGWDLHCKTVCPLDMVGTVEPRVKPEASFLRPTHVFGCEPPPLCLASNDWYGAVGPEVPLTSRVIDPASVGHSVVGRHPLVGLDVPGYLWKRFVKGRELTVMVEARPDLANKQVPIRPGSLVYSRSSHWDRPRVQMHRGQGGSIPITDISTIQAGKQVYGIKPFFTTEDGARKIYQLEDPSGYSYTLGRVYPMRMSWHERLSFWLRPWHHEYITAFNMTPHDVPLAEGALSAFPDRESRIRAVAALLRPHMEESLVGLTNELRNAMLGSDDADVTMFLRAVDQMVVAGSVLSTTRPNQLRAFAFH